MKKLFIVAAVIVAVVGCTKSSLKQAPVEEWAGHIIEQYPNFNSNDISRQIVADSVASYANKFVGQKADMLNGVKFYFAKMVDSGDSVAVFFDATEFEKDGDYVWTDLHIRVLGKIDRKTAETLDKEKKYYISGKVHAWDAEDLFNITHPMLDNIDLGTFILNSDIEIVEAVEE